jgi:hypothetical protein
VEIIAPIKWILLSIFLLFWLYIACRLGAMGIARSWFAEKKKERKVGKSQKQKEEK